MARIICGGKARLLTQSLQPWWTIGGVYTATQVVYAANFKVGADLAAAIVNDVPGGTGTVSDPGGGATPTYVEGTGVTGDGLATYLASDITPATDQTWSMFIQYGGATTVLGTLAGCYDGAAHFFVLMPLFAGGALYGNGNYIQVAPTLAAGNVGVAGTRGYRNGTAEGDAIAAAAGTAYPIFTLARNNAGVAGTHMAATITALWIANVTITAPQAATLAAAMAAL